MKMASSVTRLVAIQVFLLLLAFGARAGIPRPAEVPPDAPEPERSMLSQERAMLLKEWEALKRAISRHNGRCRDVRPGSRRMSGCSAAQKRLQSLIRAYAARAVVFNDRVAGAGGRKEMTDR